MATKRKRKGKRIAPRLFDGNSRVSIGHGLPEEIKDGLRAIAIQENRSLSWILEEVIIKYFGFRKPRYVKVKEDK